mmetsp:Transcript_12313/g.24329  ORF Transcript_12313/g.24329 Transcript_12313/m.24329 type:complete len:242 (+) Transcript_12313:78-803(+)
MSKVVYAASVTAALVIGRAVLTRAASSAASRSVPLASAGDKGACRAPRSNPRSGGRLFRGSVVHSLALGQLQVLHDALLLVSSSGTILELVDLATFQDDTERSQRVHSLTSQGYLLTTLTPTQLLVPGFVDGHAHAPQYAFVGTGMDMPLLDWLETYTFPCEAKFKDLQFAKEVYRKAVARSLLSGTTTCSWFATLHLEAAKELGEDRAGVWAEVSRGQGLDGPQLPSLLRRRHGNGVGRS